MQHFRELMTFLLDFRPLGTPLFLIVLTSAAMTACTLVVAALVTLPYVPEDEQAAAALATLVWAFPISLGFQLLVWYVGMNKALASFQEGVEEQNEEDGHR